MISYLQEVPFAINEEVFKIIEDSMHELVYAGLLMPPFLAQVKPKLVRQALKNELNSDRFKGKFRYSYMYRVIVKRIQRARYEQGLLALARAYVGYDIDFPAFIDFRGRIYRAGILHFHERDFAKCLISFPIGSGDVKFTGKEDKEEATTYMIEQAVGFHHHLALPFLLVFL